MHNILFITTLSHVPNLIQSMYAEVDEICVNTLYGSIYGPRPFNKINISKLESVNQIKQTIKFTLTKNKILKFRN